MQMRIWIDRRGSRNTLRLSRAGSTRKGMRVDVGIGPYEPHKVGNVPNFIRQIFNGRTRNDTYLFIVRSGNPILRSPEGRSLT